MGTMCGMASKDHPEKDTRKETLVMSQRLETIAQGVREGEGPPLQGHGHI